MGKLRRRMRVERLESRSLLTAAVGIPDLVINPADEDSSIVAPIEIENAAGVRAATVEIHYDPERLQTENANVRAGSIWGGKGMTVANVDDQVGKITAFIFATHETKLSSGSLLDINFLFKDETAGRGRATIDLENVRLNEGDIPTSSEPIRSQSAIDGSIARVGPPPRSSAPPFVTPPVQPVGRSPVAGPPSNGRFCTPLAKPADSTRLTETTKRSEADALMVGPFEETFPSRKALVFVSL